MKWHKLLFALFLIGISACSTQTAPATTITPEPTKIPTDQPSPTPEPIQYVVLGSPFASDCGDGIPRIWSNDAFNAPGDHQFDEHHGHVDIFAPKGCKVDDFDGEILAPVSGILEPYPNRLPGGYHLILPPKTYIEGLEDALIYAGIKNQDLSSIRKIEINFGHFKPIIETSHEVFKGQSIGDIVPCCGHQKIAYQIVVWMHEGTGIMFTPTIFPQEGPKWVCVPNSPYDCVAEPNDFIK